MASSILVWSVYQRIIFLRMEGFFKSSYLIKVFFIFEADFLISFQISTKCKCVLGYLCCVVPLLLTG